MSVITYPIPAFQNMPINAHYYSPSRFVISNITRGATTIVQVTENLNYYVGQLVRFIVPDIYGMYQINEMTGYVLSFPSSNEAEVAIDSTKFDAFQNTTFRIDPQLLAVGDVNTGVTNTQGRLNNGTFIPGSFINISPG